MPKITYKPGDLGVVPGVREKRRERQPVYFVVLEGGEPGEGIAACIVELYFQKGAYNVSRDVIPPGSIPLVGEAPAHIHYALQIICAVEGHEVPPPQPSKRR